MNLLLAIFSQELINIWCLNSYLWQQDNVRVNDLHCNVGTCIGLFMCFFHIIRVFGISTLLAGDRETGSLNPGCCVKDMLIRYVPKSLNIFCQLPVVSRKPHCQQLPLVLFSVEQMA